MNKILKYSLFIVTVIFIFSCSSGPKQSEIISPLDYSNNDVILNEINNIKRIQKNNSVEALYRAYFLKKETVLQECIELVESQLFEFINDKNYLEAKRLYDSLDAINHQFSAYTKKQLESIKNNDIPGTRISSSKIPKTIKDCINATVTMWVDKGMKVQNGSLMQDIIIGSGFFIDERGYLVTNYHVIQSMVDSKYEGYSRLYVKLSEDPDTKIPAKVVGYDSVLDLALVKVDIEPAFCLSLGSSSDLSVGDKVSAIGTPIGLEGTLTSGIVSSVDRKLNTMGVVFQLDAAVNSGNSGGPLIDENKKVQAIVFAGILQYQGLNFAIPVEYLKQELPYLYNGGELEHTWIGAYGNTKKIRTEKKGLEVLYAMPGKSASFSKLNENDIITEINGTKIKSIEDFQFALMGYKPNTIVKCKYTATDGNEKETILLLSKRAESPTVDFYNSDLINSSFLPLFGMKLTPSSTTNRKLYTITKVINGSTADELGFSENDPITVRKVELDDINKMLIAHLYVQRRKKGFLDMTMVVGTSYDSPYYF